MICLLYSVSASLPWEPRSEAERSLRSAADGRAHWRNHTLTHTSRPLGARGPSAPPRCAAGWLQQWKHVSSSRALTSHQAPDPNSHQYSRSVQEHLLASTPPPRTHVSTALELSFLTLPVQRRNGKPREWFSSRIPHLGFQWVFFSRCSKTGAEFA